MVVRLLPSMCYDLMALQCLLPSSASGTRGQARGQSVSLYNWCCAAAVDHVADNDRETDGAEDAGSYVEVYLTCFYATGTYLHVGDHVYRFSPRSFLGDIVYNILHTA